MAALIDALLLLAFAVALQWRFTPAAASKEAARAGINFSPSLSLEGLPAVIFVVTTIAYFALLEGFLGFTAGKLVLGMRIVNCNGRAPGLKAAVVRDVLRVIDLPLVGLLVTTISRQKQRVGDQFAGTYVVSRAGAKAIRNRGGIPRGRATGAIAVLAALLLLLGTGGYLALQSNNPVSAQISNLLPWSPKPTPGGH